MFLSPSSLPSLLTLILFSFPAIQLPLACHKSASSLSFPSSFHPNSLSSSTSFRWIQPLNSPNPPPPPTSLHYPSLFLYTQPLSPPKPCHLLTIIHWFSGKHPPTSPLTANIGHSAHGHWKLQTGFWEASGGLTLGSKETAATWGNEDKGKGALVWFGWLV